MTPALLAAREPQNPTPHTILRKPGRLHETPRPDARGIDPDTEITEPHPINASPNTAKVRSTRQPPVKQQAASLPAETARVDAQVTAKYRQTEIRTQSRRDSLRQLQTRYSRWDNLRNLTAPGTRRTPVTSATQFDRTALRPLTVHMLP